MKVPAPARTCWLLVVVFAVAMAWVEAASVYYLRVMVDRLNPYQANPLPMRGVLEQVELAREAATLVMLVTIGALAGWTSRTRLGYAAIAFGVWDIFYYVFLKMICGWPRSLFDWDVLFLLPLPWCGPVLAPVCIAARMIVWGIRILPGSNLAHRRGILRHSRIGGQQRNAFDDALRHQDAVERVAVQRRQVGNRYGVFAGDRQLAIAVV